MRKTTHKIAVMVAALALCAGLAACRESSRVSYNVSKEADNFNVMRRIVVLNVRSDTVLYELTGRFALQNDDANELVVVCETDEGKYKKDYIYLNDWTTYVVEDMDGNDVDQYHYELNILPQMVGGMRVTMNN